MEPISLSLENFFFVEWNLEQTFLDALNNILKVNWIWIKLLGKLDLAWSEAPHPAVENIICAGADIRNN